MQKRVRKRPIFLSIIKNIAYKRKRDSKPNNKKYIIDIQLVTCKIKIILVRLKIYIPLPPKLKTI